MRKASSNQALGVLGLIHTYICKLFPIKVPDTVVKLTKRVGVN